MIKDIIDSICERGQHCSCWFDGCWGECCKRHDRRYSNKRLTRAQADKLLFRCVLRKSNLTMACLMYLGVRLFGASRYKAAQL